MHAEVVAQRHLDGVEQRELVGLALAGGVLRRVGVVHQVDDVDGLLQIQQQLYAKVEQATGADGQLEALIKR